MNCRGKPQVFFTVPLHLKTPTLTLVWVFQQLGHFTLNLYPPNLVVPNPSHKLLEIFITPFTFPNPVVPNPCHKLMEIFITPFTLPNPVVPNPHHKLLEIFITLIMLPNLVVPNPSHKLCKVSFCINNNQ